jgi:ABC-type lipopolysaccharide export system ATPase subunit
VAPATWPTVAGDRQPRPAVLVISDRPYVLAGGQLRMEGTPAELTARPDFVNAFLGGGRDHSVSSGDA